MIRAGITGGAGYTGGETIRLLLNHPETELKSVHSNSNAGNRLWEVHRDLLGETDMRFSGEVDTDVDVMFLCMGHGEARRFLEENPIPDRVKIIDLSQDFRLEGNDSIGGRRFVYGLPEFNRGRIAGADNIANPGCFATCIQLGLLPLADRGALHGEINISATTGSTGAGQKPAPTSHFSWRADNMSVYKAFEHQHLGEIGRSLKNIMPDYAGTINFIPYRGDFTRGIIAAMYLDSEYTENEAAELYRAYYDDAPFTWVSDGNIDLKQVVNTNKCFVHVEKHGNKLLIISIIDNLLKGASGQAVQNMNLIFGLPETTGLKLKAAAF